MQRHLIALDLDGTTLNNQSQLSARTKYVLTQARLAGHIVSIVTGRPNRLSESIYDELALTGPMVNFNGALIYIPHKKWNQEFHVTVDRELVFTLMQMRDHYGIQMIEAEGKNLLLADHPFVNDYLQLPPVLAANQILNRQNLQVDPTSITVFIDRQDMDTIQTRLTHDFPNASIAPWGGPSSVLEIVHHGIQKAKGVAYLAQYYHISNQNVIAFGDEHNDAEMLSAAGWGVAMANGTSKIKSLANDVTLRSNDEDGLADYLNRYLQLNLPLAFDREIS